MEDRNPPWFDYARETGDALDDAYEAFGAWERWIYQHVDESLPENEPAFLDGLDVVHKAYLYNLMCRLFVDDPSLRRPADVPQAG